MLSLRIILISIGDTTFMPLILNKTRDYNTVVQIWYNIFQYYNHNL